MMPNSLSWWISNSSDKYIVTWFCGTAVTGIYSVAYKMPSMISVVVQIFYNAWSISAVDGFGSEETLKFYNSIYKKYIAGTFFFASGIIWMNKILAYFLYSDDFFEAWLYVPVLVLAVVYHGMGSFVGSIYTSAKKTRILLFSTVAGAAANIVLNLIMVPLWGPMGAAIATCISYLVIWAIRCIGAGNIMKLDFRLKDTLLGSILLIGQIIIICMDWKFSFWIAGGICIVVFLLYRKTLLSFTKLLRRKKHG